MVDPYARMRAWLFPLVALAACSGDGGPKDDTATPLEGVEGTGCLEVPIDTETCPPAAELALTDLTGNCGSTTLSIDGEGFFGGDPTGAPQDSATTWCCYPIHETEPSCVYGRPFLVDGRARRAEVADAGGWSGEAGACALPEEARAALARAWEQAATDEHAAVAAFARVALELLALGAPADLVDDTLRAAREEVAHARLGFGLASRYAGGPRSPVSFPVHGAPDRAPDLVSFAVATAREGCVGETVTTLLAAECLARTTDPEVRAALTRIVADEEGHARLAWRTVRWAIDAGGAPVRAAVAAVFAELAARGMPLPDRLADGPHRDHLVAHGLPDAALARRAIDRALAEVVLPAGRALVAEPAGAPAHQGSPPG